MAKSAETAPFLEAVVPLDQPELAEIVRRAHDTITPIYPRGGGTRQAFGLPAKRPGIELSLANLTRIVDYPARDMTITVEAGITLQSLAVILAAEGQRLPIDSPAADRATLGGLIATATSGPRRYSNGTIRDYVIGITAVDGRGVTFHAGGRVVKNVAGYDLCKLLCGSLGTLAVITQVTLKLRPVPAASAFMTATLSDYDQAERLLSALVHSQTSPAAIELLAGPRWQDDPALPPERGGSLRLVVGLEGTSPEVAWMAQQLPLEWQALGLAKSHFVTGDAAIGLWQRLGEFPAAGSGIVLKANVLPSATVHIVRMLLSLDPEASIQAHAGNGIVVARLANLSGSDLSHALLQKLQPAALAAAGNVIVLGGGEGLEATRRIIWGNAPGDLACMEAVKKQFDPYGLLNPGRFIYSAI